MPTGQSGASKRKLQNVGIKSGTVRLGAKGKYMRKYNATTGRWEKVSGNVKKAVAAGRSRSQYKPMTRSSSGSSKPAATPTSSSGSTSQSKSAYSQYVSASKRPRQKTNRVLTTPEARLQALKRGLTMKIAQQRGMELKKKRTAAEEARLKKLNAEISQLRKNLG